MRERDGEREIERVCVSERERRRERDRESVCEREIEHSIVNQDTVRLDQGCQDTETET